MSGASPRVGCGAAHKAFQQVKSMAAITQTPLELFQLGTIRHILQATGPCITISLAPYHPGEAAGSMALQLNSHLQNISERLAKHGVPPGESADLLRPLRGLAEAPEFAGGSHWGRVICSAPDVLKQFYLVKPAPSGVKIASTFFIRKIGLELARPRSFYVLNLSKTHVELWRCAGLQAERMKLPNGVPATLDEAMGFKAPDHTLENRSAAGGSAGAARRIRFGTGSLRETQQLHLADYYKLVGRGLRQSLSEPDIPIVLGGVEEDCALFRAAGEWPHLAKRAISGGQNDLLDDAQLLQTAYEILAEEDLEAQARFLKAARERLADSRFVTKPSLILEAAFSGRVDHLFVSENAEGIGFWERGNYRSWEHEDLVNLAMVQTIIHHGEAYSLPQSLMPQGMEVAALMRY
jgi:hypothetical protein